MSIEDFFNEWELPSPEEHAAHCEIEWAADALSCGVDPREVKARREQVDEVWTTADQVSEAIENLAGGVATEMSGDTPVKLLGTVADRRLELDRALLQFEAALVPGGPPAMKRGQS